MEAGLPMLNCLLQHTLRSLCSYSDSSSSSSSSKWVYAVFWRILPRNYPPPKWDYGGSALDRSKGNKRNWSTQILVWEDGFCDFHECERAGSGYVKGRFGADIFFKMSHEVYNYGEGLVGKIAADNSHKWVHKEIPNENDPGFISSWNMSIEPQPKAWTSQFNSGIQTIAIISVREGIIQLGSLDKMVEDLNLVISIQRKFSYLQSIPGVFAIQRPYLPIQHPYALKPNNQMPEHHETATICHDDKRQFGGTKRLIDERPEDSPIKSINLGWNSPQNGIIGPPFWSIPPLLPTVSCSLGALLSKLPSVIPSYSVSEPPEINIINYTNNTNQRGKADNEGSLGEVPIAETKIEASNQLEAADEEKPRTVKANLVLQDDAVVELGFGPLKD
ncbi:transcription factor LHW-like isoform X2 [Gossypium australe]|uniref:Transcription factor LHW-like isoform X2 n=1 Tax=Gossypium australe TaxID=47621 RepID=A0A5B6X4V9_9ROSI|nr:transcription factor LHW-like isoform X2 [Gossypium australe]